ncbi:transposase [Peribacillus frigoritolerans]|uniref:Transposase n=1 Tax=Peribacillus castrilensis TaxID=2897690 RepID=A0AAW9NJZ6_9BACI|nr:transposase [Peribacillus castrilensis]
MKYSKEKKVEAVQMNGEGGMKKITKNVGLGSSTQLKAWVKKFKEDGEFEGLQWSYDNKAAITTSIAWY